MYGVDLADLWTGGMSMRRAANLATWLPLGSAVYQSEKSDLAWSTGEHLQRASLYLLEVISFQLGGAEGAEPTPVPSPADAPKQLAKIEKDRDKAKAWKARQEARAAARQAGREGAQKASVDPPTKPK